MLFREYDLPNVPEVSFFAPEPRRPEAPPWRALTSAVQLSPGTLKMEPLFHFLASPFSYILQHNCSNILLNMSLAVSRVTLLTVMKSIQVQKFAKNDLLYGDVFDAIEI
jgi:hypothetical protein